ncbi:MAG: class I SAM-dependent methyltransferase [Desulfuromonas thiophila]|nr:class I SAM-dependent methyltransferase [Desulfuromonas thiophila]
MTQGIMTQDKRIKDFNPVAQSWDAKPQRQLLAQAVAGAIRSEIPLAGSLRALEFGCGTGLVSYLLLPQLATLTGVDRAPAMLQVFEQKASELGQGERVSTFLATDDTLLPPGDTFELIYSSMVLHHVPDYSAVVARLVTALAPGGYLALADLDLEDGDFHDQAEGVAHAGIDRELLQQLLRQQGLVAVRAMTAHCICKQRASGEKVYPVFLVTGQRPPA